MRIVFATAAFLLLGTSVAAAQSQVFVTEFEGAAAGEIDISGPHPAGNAVVWGERHAKRIHLRSLATNGAVADVGSVPSWKHGSWSWELEAGEGRIAFVRHDTVCPDGCRYGDPRIVAGELRLGPIGGPYTLLASCRVGEECDVRNQHCAMYGGLGLVSGMLSYGVGCGSEGRLVTRDIATGKEYAFARPQSSLWSRAGRYVAVFEPDAPARSGRGDLIVHDALSGDEVYRLEDQPANYFDQPTNRFAVGDDGTLALLDPNSGELSWADETEPFPHALARVAPTRYPELMVRNRLIALVTYTPRRLSLFNLAGQQASQVDHDPAVAGWGFDGRRFAWASQPCALVVIRVWDRFDGPPDLPSSPCPAAKVATPRSDLDRRGRLVIRASCPPRSVLGCRGRFRVRAKFPGRRQELTYPTNYSIAPGSSQRYALPLRTPRDFIERHEPLTAIAISRAVRREGFDARERRRFKFKISS